jgi:hypothetical protein
VACVLDERAGIVDLEDVVKRSAGFRGGKHGDMDASVSAHARHGTTIKWSFAYKRVDGVKKTGIR